jgi:hypothetical protein
MKILHRHHIIPKHAGGTDEEENLVLLTIEEHAEAHRLLFEEYGRPEDYLAWKGLAGCVGKDDIIIMRNALRDLSKPRPNQSKAMKGRKKSEAHKKAIAKAHKGKPKSEAHKKSLSLSATGRKMSAESIKKNADARRGKKRGPYKKKDKQ